MSLKFKLNWSSKRWKIKFDQRHLGEDRVIASPVAGTTRDAIDTHFTDADGQEFTMIDTAGMRKSGKVYENTEKYSVMRAMRAIDRSDVVLMVPMQKKVFASTTSVSQVLPTKPVKG